MSMNKISDEDVKTAINAARDALMKNSDLAWVRKSSLVERAYFMGLLNGLSAIANDDVTGKLMVQILAGTIFSRAADDTFPSTQLGQDFAALKVGLQSLRTGNGLDPSVIEKVVSDINLLDREWNGCVKSARSLLADIQSMASELRPRSNGDVLDAERAHEEHSQIERRVFAVNDMVRFIALLKTHHELSKRLESD